MPLEDMRSIGSGSNSPCSTLQCALFPLNLGVVNGQPGGNNDCRRCKGRNHEEVNLLAMVPWDKKG